MKRILTVLGLVFGASVAGLVTLISLAYENHEGVIHTDYYERGLDYQAILDGYDMSGRWFLSGSILNQNSFTRGESPFTLRLDGQPTNQRPTVTVTFERRASTVGRQVRRLSVVPSKGGFDCSGSVKLPLPGLWEVTAVAEIEGRKIFKRNFIEVL